MIKLRVIQLLEYKGITKEVFFRKIGMSSANFRGNAASTPLNSTAIENIFTEVPDLNLDWLITGKGDMIKGDSVIFFPPKPPKAPPEPTVIYKSDPKDAEIIELQREQIQLLKEKLADFKKDHIGYVRSTPIPPAAAPASAKVDPLVKLPDLAPDQPSKRP